MKILFILTYYYPHWTGLTQYARRLAEGLAGKGYEVKVLTTKHEENLQKIEHKKGVTIIRKPILFRLSRTVISLSLVLSLWREIGKSEVVIIYTPLSEVLLIAIIAKIMRKKFILVHNGDLILPNSFLNELVEKLYYWLTASAVKISNGIIIQTKDYSERSTLLLSVKNRWKVIVPLYEKIKENKKISRKLRARLYADKKHVVGFAGRFVEEKGFDILLKSIPFILKKLPDTQFVFAGETNVNYENFYSKNKILINKNKKNLIFLGRLNENEMGSFYKLCNVFVVPSRSDCFPSVEIEALLSSVPVVVANIPGARWAVKQTKMGVVVEANNALSLADGIIKVLINRERYIKFKKAAELFNYDKTLEKYCNFLDS